MVETKLSYTAKDGFDIKNTPRPTEYSEQVQQLLIEKTTEKLFKWTEELEPFPNTEEQQYFRENTAEFLKHSLRYSDSGFEIAKRFTNKWGCDGDSELVQILEDATTFDKWRIVEQLERDWIKDNNIVLTLDKNMSIIYNYRQYKHLIKRYEGIIIDIHPTMAKYTVRVSSDKDNIVDADYRADAEEVQVKDGTN